MNIEELFNLLPEEEQVKFLPLIESLNKAEEREIGQTDFLSFVNSMWPGFIYGRHHALMAQKFEDIRSGKDPVWGQRYRDGDPEAMQHLVSIQEQMAR
jgi:hypothetical protein